MDVFKMVPKSGFFPRYLAYAIPLTDSPEVFHVSAAIAVYSAVVSNYIDIEFDVPTGIIGPDGKQLINKARSSTNVWILNVAPSGDRKGKAINLAVGVAHKTIEDQISGMSSSPESTFDLVTHHNDAFFLYAEGAGLFSMFYASYWKHGQGLFPQLYDGDPMRRELSGQRTKKTPSPETLTIDIARPRVGMLVGVAPTHLDAARGTDWTGGFIGRMAMVFAERDRFNPIGGMFNDAEKAALETVLFNTRQRLIKVTGSTMPVGMHPDALALYAAWSRKVDHDQREKPPKTRSLFNRLPEHVKRISALYAVSQDFTEIDVGSMEAAIHFGNYVGESIDRVGSELTDDQVVRTVVRLQRLLKNHDGPYISMRDTMRLLNLSRAALRYPIESLVSAGELELVFSGEGNRQQWLVKKTPASKMGK